MCQNLPQRGLTLWLTAYVLIQLGRFTEDRTKLQESLQEKPEDPGGMLNAIQALLFAVEGKETEAEEQIRQAAETGPPSQGTPLYRIPRAHVEGVGLLQSAPFRYSRRELTSTANAVELTQRTRLL